MDFFQPRPLQDASQSYLVGYRGFLVLQSFLWIFLSTFVPAAVKYSANISGPLHHIVIRKTLSVLFWNETLIYSSFILLSARTIALPFLLSPSRTVLASSIFRRGIRLFIPTAVALAIATGASYGMPSDFMTYLAGQTNNTSLNVPHRIPNTLAYFNSAFNIFWVTRDWDLQAASRAFPGQNLWVVSIIFEQSYTLFMTEVIIPYTLKGWRVIGGTLFVLTAWWVGSWAWYTITGLLLADAVTNMDFAAFSRIGIKISVGRLNPWNKHDDREIRLPTWIVYAMTCTAGLVMKYIWIGVRPDLEDTELKVHSADYNTVRLDTAAKNTVGLARSDNYVILLGFFLLLDTTKWMQRLFSVRLFVALGHRSFSWFLVQGVVVYTAGISLFWHLRLEQDVPFEGSVVVCFVVCSLATIAAGEVFFRLVDLPVQKFAGFAFEWIRT